MNMSAKTVFGRLSEICAKQDKKLRHGFEAEELAHLILIDHQEQLEEASDSELASFMEKNAALVQKMADQKAAIRKDVALVFSTIDTNKRFGFSHEEVTEMLIEPMAVLLNEEEGSEALMDDFLINLEDAARKKGIREYMGLPKEHVLRLTEIVERSPYMRQE